MLKQIRQQQQSTDLLKVWDELLVEDGVFITQTRASVLRQLQKFSQDYHSQLTQSTETLYICHCPSLESEVKSRRQMINLRINYVWVIIFVLNYKVFVQRYCLREYIGWPTSG